MKKITKILAIAIFIFTSVGLFAQQTEAIDLNDPKYSSETFQSILDQYKGKVVYLDFWASWCGPCKKEMPYSEKLQDTFKGKDVVFLYISVDRNGQSWQNMMKQLHLKGEHYRANATVHQELNAQFNVRSIPRYVLIDKKGKVNNANALRPSNPQVVESIQQLL